MREMWMMAPVLFPVVSGGALWIWNPEKNKIHTAAAVLSLAEAVCSWLVILNCMGMKLPLWSIGPGLELCLRLDGTGALFSGLASLIWVLVVFFAFEYMEHEKEDARFFGCLIMSLGALTGVAWAGIFVTLYLFFEMMTFSAFPWYSIPGRGKRFVPEWYIWPIPCWAHPLHWEDISSSASMPAERILRRAGFWRRQRNGPGQAADSSSGCFLYGGRIFL